ncbi:MAG: hypothetical protein K2K92_03360, partial [Duncaniella sp.]|nr:hypothetical protein [Duncaniella sp.]
MMSRFTYLILFFLSLPMLMSAKDEGKVEFMFSVKDAQLGFALPEARLIPYDSLGNPGDTVKVLYYHYKGRIYDEEESRFVFTLPRREGLYNFDVVCPRYETQTVTYRLDKSKVKESYVTISPVLMQRESQKLGEVTVMTSKIKFYHKGDTLVYNADAFQLAEGSMLDALIAQLPGVELKDGGQITVNGEYVEELLLNGREFMSDDRRVMLENIGAYTVKDIQVYQGQTLVDKWRGDPNAARRLTMDVKLKKEYSTGLTLNAQGG